MLPIYSDLLKMWSDLGYDLPIKEGKYWLENNFIQAFTRDGTLRKLWKYKVFDDLHIEITPYHNKIKFLTYYELYINSFSMRMFLLLPVILLLSSDTFITFSQMHSKSLGIEYSLTSTMLFLLISLHQS